MAQYNLIILIRWSSREITEAVCLLEVGTRCTENLLIVVMTTIRKNHHDTVCYLLFPQVNGFEIESFSTGTGKGTSKNSIGINFTENVL